MEGYFPRLLGLDKNEDYRRRYRAVQKLEQKTVELTVSFSNAQKKHNELRMASNQCREAVDLANSWIGLKEKLQKLASRKGGKADEERRKLKAQELRVAEGLKLYFPEEIDDEKWRGIDGAALACVRSEFSARLTRILEAIETCVSHYRNTEEALGALDAQKREQYEAILKLVSQAFRAASTRLYPAGNATEQARRTWADAQNAYQVLSNPQLLRKYVLTDSHEGFCKDMRMSTGTAPQMQAAYNGASPSTAQPSGLTAPTRTRGGPPQPCRMPLVVDRATDSTNITTLTVQWHCVTADEGGIIEYQLQRKGKRSDTFEIVYEGSATECIVDCVPDEYIFRVRARNTVGAGKFSPSLFVVAEDLRQRKQLQSQMRKKKRPEASRSAERALVTARKEAQGASGFFEISTKAGRLAESLNVARRYKLSYVNEDLMRQAETTLRKCWRIGDRKLPQQWQSKFDGFLRETLEGSQMPFIQFLESGGCDTLAPAILNMCFNYVVNLATRAVNMGYGTPVLDGVSKIIESALNIKNASLAFWIKRMQYLYNLIRRRRQQIAEKLKSSAKRSTGAEEDESGGPWIAAKSRNNKDKGQSQAQLGSGSADKAQKQLEDDRRREKEAARKREAKRKALYDRLYQQQVTQGKVVPKVTKSTSKAKSGSSQAVKPTPKFRSYPKHHQQGKFQLCKFWLVGQQCRKEPCWFAHGKDELADWYRQREEEQARKKQQRKAAAAAAQASRNGGGSASKPAAKPKPVSKRKEAQAPAQTKTTTKPPVVKSVWGSLGAAVKRAGGAPRPGGEPKPRQTDAPTAQSGIGASSAGRPKQPQYAIRGGKSQDPTSSPAVAAGSPALPAAAPKLAFSPAQKAPIQPRLGGVGGPNTGLEAPFGGLSLQFDNGIRPKNQSGGVGAPTRTVFGAPGGNGAPAAGEAKQKGNLAPGSGGASPATTGSPLPGVAAFSGMSAFRGLAPGNTGLPDPLVGSSAAGGALNMGFYSAPFSGSGGAGMWRSGGTGGGGFNTSSTAPMPAFPSQSSGSSSLLNTAPAGGLSGSALQSGLGNGFGSTFMAPGGASQFSTAPRAATTAPFGFGFGGLQRSGLATAGVPKPNAQGMGAQGMAAPSAGAAAPGRPGLSGQIFGGMGGVSRLGGGPSMFGTMSQQPQQQQQQQQQQDGASSAWRQ